MKHYFVAVLCLLVIGGCIFPDLALCASPFAGGTDTLKTDLVGILTPVAGIGVIALGVLCLFGKISWWWLVGFIIGVVLIFGADQMVSWMRSAFGV